MYHPARSDRHAAHNTDEFVYQGEYIAAQTGALIARRVADGEEAISEYLTCNVQLYPRLLDVYA